MGNAQYFAGAGPGGGHGVTTEGYSHFKQLFPWATQTNLRTQQRVSFLQGSQVRPLRHHDLDLPCCVYLRSASGSALQCDPEVPLDSQGLATERDFFFLNDCVEMFA